MAIKHFTSRGEPIDMNSIMAKHAQTTALGNANMNARGDILGTGGVVLKTQEQIDAEWRRAREQQNGNTIGISPDIRAPLPGQQPRKVLADDQDFEPTPISNLGRQPMQVMTEGEAVMNLVDKPGARRRKIVETD